MVDLNEFNPESNKKRRLLLVWEQKGTMIADVFSLGFDNWCPRPEQAVVV
eukprot:NODE_5255_length_598_cov_246.517495.p3 GENE.NODE_5255_length_598_cov_246.517495~~NODE_5255_length_598_cov_246.517495.p3  ORF type:complete len:50 (-),score=13.54 NODE_5255_length_598_cov_246.517495:126-275(-)